MWRHEYKYLITNGQLEVLRTRVQSLMLPDPYTNGQGTYRIRSLYWDDYNNICYYENENGVDPRQKFRIRIYNNADDNVKLELKRKFNGMCQKTSCNISPKEFDRLMNNEPLKVDAQRPLLNLLLNEINTRGYRPVVVVDYNREPFVYPIGNVRVTFDTNISSGMIQDFFNDNAHLRPILPVGIQILEVKFDDLIPDFIYRALQLDDLVQTAFSKYYLCRKITIKY